MTRQRLMVAGLVIAAIGIVIPVAALGQTSTTGSFNGLKNGGFVRLHFPDAAQAATVTQVSSLNPATAVTLAGPQNITVGQSCVANVAASPDLLRFSPNGANLGAETSGNKFVGLGIKSRGSSGTNCGRVEPGESMSMTLGNGLLTTDNQPGTSLLATAAEFDIDAKGQALIRADLFNGTTRVGFALLSTTSSSGDSGPDATSGDNFAFPLNGGMPACGGTAETPTPPGPGQVCGTFAAFRSVTLSTSTRPSGTPSFSVEGGRSTDARSAYAWDTLDLRTNTADTVFQLQQSDGVLNCGDTKTIDATDSFTRGANNKDGSTCVVVGYDYDASVDGDTKSVQLLWDTATQPAATFTLTQAWLPEDSTTLPDGRPIPTKSTLVEWDDTIGFITAPACTSPSLPTTFGTIAAPVTPGDTSVQVLLAQNLAARSDPFNLQIGNEVVTVTPPTAAATAGSTVTLAVTRARGDTTAGTYAVSAKVMTTPFPIVTHLGNPIVAQMCIAESSWEPTGITGSNGLPQVQVTETLFAEGDMIGKH